MFRPPKASRSSRAWMCWCPPSTVRREEYGSLKGTVEKVSHAFPVSLDGMIAVLQNRKLAETFSESGPPYSGRVRSGAPTLPPPAASPGRRRRPRTKP